MTTRSLGLGRSLIVATTALMAITCSKSTVYTPPSPSPTAPARPTAAAATPGTSAAATIRDGTGARVGMATFTDTYSGVLIVGTVTGLGLGQHGVHIHAIGKCEPPFTSAGPHFNPLAKQHGFANPNGPHLGDMPNIDTPAAGALHFEVLLPGVTLKGTNALLDADGAAIVIHAARDDYKTDPSGDSGSRIACGAIVAR
ncbi:MAG TPA: superoxide dismutase family protein [Gemmatimonadaceae bacterium]|nr:superoxide dismutase family protein [Gemmatimonadaceae bacterium]